MIAAIKGDAQCVDLLIKAGSDVTATDNVRGGEGIGGWACGDRYYYRVVEPRSSPLPPPRPPPHLTSLSCAHLPGQVDCPDVLGIQWPY